MPGLGRDMTFRVVHCGTGNIGREALAVPRSVRGLAGIDEPVGDSALLVTQYLGRLQGFGASLVMTPKTWSDRNIFVRCRAS
jgi:hypothetical protein